MHDPLIREDAIQIDKTLTTLGRQATEVERVVRVILGSCGRLLALFVGWRAGDLARPFADGSSALSHLEWAVADAVATAADIRGVLQAA